ncbi:DMT family transporter [Candidatus Saccharibacteria bacterium]|nr:DMT family transporter [Candidatus Saccharibacteria bacterium]
MELSKYKFLGGAAVFFAAILWSLDSLLRTTLFALPPLTIVFAEHAIGTAIAIPILLILRKKLKPLTRKQKMAILTVGALSGVVGTLLFTAALLKVNFDNFSVVILLQQLQPIFAISAAAVLLKEKMNLRFIGLAALAVFGAFLLNFPELKVNFDYGNATTMAGIMAVGAAAAWGSSTALSKYSLKGTFWGQITALRFGIATIISGLGLLLFPSTNGLGQLQFVQIQALSLIAVSTGFVAVGIYYFGLQRIRASRATILELAFPMTAVFIGYFKFNNMLSWTQIVGALIVTAVSFYIIRNEAKLSGKQITKK